MSVDGNLSALDNWMSAFSTKLRDDLGIGQPESLKLAISIRGEIRALPLDSVPTLSEDSGDCPLALKDRWEMLNDYLEWLFANMDQPNPFGQIVSFNYVAFVYLGDSCFKVLRKHMPKDSVTCKCCVLLTDNPVRAFRNALAHGNWRIATDKSGIDFWAKKGSEKDEPMVRWRFTQNDLSSCQQLAIATAYASMAAL